MSSTSSPRSARDSFPPSVLRVGGNDAYEIGVWRNVMILHIDGPLDEPFFDAALAGHHSALRFDETGYGLVVLVGPGATVPGLALRARASALRAETQHMLRAQSILLNGEGFFASAMRAVLTGILSVARSRVPTKMVTSEIDAATFVVERACPPGVRVDDLYQALTAVRAG